MKIRNGFVSNSSSSSFIIIDASAGYCKPESIATGDTLVVDNNFGWHEFGWERERYNSTGTKIIFAYLQTQYAATKYGKKYCPGQENWLPLLEKVIKDYTGVKEIAWLITTEYGENWLTRGYIDHQSCATEGENTEMFESEQTLKDFLFGELSYIQTQNDNCDD